MKQQKPSTNRTNPKTEWPPHPLSPHLKTIGGEADKQAVDEHNNNTRDWYHNFQSKLDGQISELEGELRDLKARVSVLEKAASP